MKPLHITDKSFHSEVINNKKPVLVQYWVEWSGPCKFFSPIVAEIAFNYGFSLSVKKINFDANPYNAEFYGVSSIPHLLLFENGELVATKIGAMSYNQLSGFVENNINLSDKEEPSPIYDDEFIGIALNENKLNVVGLTPDGRFYIKDGINQTGYPLDTSRHNI